MDDPVVAEAPEILPSSFFFSNPTAGTYFQRPGGYSMTVWARFFQRAPKKPVISRKKPRITSYNNPERYEYSNRYESVGRDSLKSSSGSSSIDQQAYYPRLSHRGNWSQTGSITHQDEELIECLRIFMCETEGSGGEWVCYTSGGSSAPATACGNNS